MTLSYRLLYIYVTVGGYQSQKSKVTQKRQAQRQVYVDVFLRIACPPQSHHLDNPALAAGRYQPMTAPPRTPLLGLWGSQANTVAVGASRCILRQAKPPAMWVLWEDGPSAWFLLPVLLGYQSGSEG